MMINNICKNLIIITHINKITIINYVHIDKNVITYNKPQVYYIH